MSSPYPFTPALPDTFTPMRIICTAYEDCGRLGQGETPNSEEIVRGMHRLNEILLLTQTQGLKLWLQYLLNITLTNGQATYSLGPTGGIAMNKPTRILGAYYQDNSGNQRPLIPLAWQDWNTLSNKTTPGQLNSYFVDKQPGLLKVSFWNQPDSIAATNGFVVLQIQQQQPTVVMLTDQLMFPPEWGIYFHWAVATQLATGQPQSVKMYCQQQALAAFEALNNWDVEDASTSFQPDIRGIGRWTSNRA